MLYGLEEDPLEDNTCFSFGQWVSATRRRDDNPRMILTVATGTSRGGNLA
jgi:hypothetical protein